ncbi:MAG: hypothetical protein IJI58_04955 [Bacilli bacterium]|nr:hypothetical protein [Bacilli bacterium]
MKRTMRKTKLLLLLTVLFISIGYAILQTNLNITGTANMNNPTWDIHWNNVQVTTGSVTGSNVTTAANIDSAKTTVSYSIKLPKPGDYYEFTVDAVNGGTIDAMIDVVSSKLNGTEITTLPDYLNYSVTYVDDIPIETNQELKAGVTETYKVRIEFKKDIENSQFPAGVISLNMDFNIIYKQATEDSKKVRDYLYSIATDKVSIGDNISTIGTTYTSYNDSGLTYLTFLRHRIHNNQVAQNDIGFIYSNNVYYLKGGGATYNSSTNKYNYDSPYYEENKGILLEVFGTSNCSSYSNETRCVKGRYDITIRRDGYVDAVCYIWSSIVFTDGGAMCIPAATPEG